MWNEMKYWMRSMSFNQWDYRYFRATDKLHYLKVKNYLKCYYKEMSKNLYGSFMTTGQCRYKINSTFKI